MMHTSITSNLSFHGGCHFVSNNHHQNNRTRTKLHQIGAKTWSRIFKRGHGAIFSPLLEPRHKIRSAEWKTAWGSWRTNRHNAQTLMQLTINTYRSQLNANTCTSDYTGTYFNALFSTETIYTTIYRLGYLWRLCILPNECCLPIHDLASRSDAAKSVSRISLAHMC